jgi:hypothetical protein
MNTLYNGHKTYWWDPTLRWQAPRGGVGLQGACIGCGTEGSKKVLGGVAAVLAILGVAGFATFVTRNW